MHSKSERYQGQSFKPKILPVVSTKGGEGKSTQTANLGGFLADAGIKLSSLTAIMPSLPPVVFIPWSMKLHAASTNC